MKVGPSSAGLSFGSNNLDRAQQDQKTQLERLASAQRINSAKDDAAGLSISTRFNSESRGLSVAIRNSGDAISRLQTEDGALGSIQEDVQRIRELELQAGNGILTDADRDALQSEISQRQANIQQTIEQANFNGQPLFTEQGGEQAQTFQTGPDAGNTIEVSGFDIQQAFADAGLDLADEQSFQVNSLSLDQLDAAIGSLVSRQTDIGAVSNRIESNIDRLSVTRENVEQADSRIADTDFAKATSEKVRADILSEVGISVQAQANEDKGNALRLLNN